MEINGIEIPEVKVGEDLKFLGERKPMEEEITDINLLRVALSRYERDRVHPEVVKARAVILQVLEPHRSYIEAHGIVPIITGSLLYNDPVNLDCDMTFVTERDVDRTEQNRFNVQIEKALDAIWPAGSNKTDITDMSISRIKSTAQQAIRGNMQSEEMAVYLMGHGTQLLTARPVFPEDQNKIDKWGYQFLQLARENDIVRAYALNHLRESVHIRSNRRHNTLSAK